MNFGDERLPVRFWSRLSVSPSGCWLWTGPLRKDGYAQIEIAKRKWLSHRLAYVMLVGPHPDGLELDHKVCSARHCCNPAHLEPVTHAENIRRGRAGQPQAARTHCPEGHPYDETNTRIADGYRRQCRECGRARFRRWYHERGGAQRQALTSAQRKARRAA